MPSQPKWQIWCLVLGCGAATGRAQQPAAEWSEPQVIQQFLARGPSIRELAARVALAEAEARTRTAYPNPTLSYSREGAGYNGFIEATQVLPVSGRMRYLREAVSAAVSATDAGREASLWTARNDLRIAFYRMVAAQQRLDLLASRLRETQELVEILRRREEEGEGSRYDRLRTERETAELRTDITAGRALVAGTAAGVVAFLPEGTEVRQVRGELAAPKQVPAVDDLVRRALNARTDYRAEERSAARYRIEEQAARRLRIPEPVISAGIKRADVPVGGGANPFENVTRTGAVFSISVPLPIFNSGRFEVMRYKAEQEQAEARRARLARQIRAEVEGARAVASIRQEALDAYDRDMQSAAEELIRITQTAYEEGEIGILELLDAYRMRGSARLRRLDLQAAAKEAFIDLERAVGEELKEVQP